MTSLAATSATYAETPPQIELNTMTTKEDGLPVRKLSRINCEKSSRFFNLNLNQKCFKDTGSLVHSFSKSNNDQNSQLQQNWDMLGYTVCDNYQEKGKSWNNSTKNLNFKPLKNHPSSNVEGEEENECQKRWMNNSNDSQNLNSSTLSLHIAAYENFIDTDANGREDILMKSKALKNADLSKLQGQKVLLEFPRQQVEDKPTAPEVQQFKASQKLLSPNQSAAPSSSNIQPAATGILITPDVHAIKDDSSGKYAALINRFFHRVTTWPQPQTVQGELLPPKPGTNQSVLVGDFHHPPENTNYRILGLRPKRTVGNLIEYEVSRLPKNPIQMRGNVPEKMPSDSVDYVMRICSSENKEERERFIHGFQMFENVRKKVAASNVRKQFMSGMGAGALSKLFYKDSTDDSGSRIHSQLLNRPLPYYIYEKIGPSLDEIIRGSYYGFLDISTARHLAVGVIRALRTFHSLEYVHRCVTSFTFSLGIYPGGFLGNADISNHVVCNDLSFSIKYRSSKKPTFTEKKFYGTLKYSSPNAMKYYQQIPADDIISAIYIFVELCHGKLLWRGETNRDEIIRKKEEFFLNPTIMVDNIDADYRIPIDIRDLALIFKMLKESSPYTGKLNYLYVFEILHRIAEANKQPNAESYLDFTKLSNVENEFRKAMERIQRGGQPSSGTKTVGNVPAGNENQKKEGGGKKAVSSKEKHKKSNTKGSKEAMGKKTKAKFKSAEAAKDAKSKHKLKSVKDTTNNNKAKDKIKSKEIVKDAKEKKKSKSNEGGKTDEKKKHPSLPVEKTQIPTPEPLTVKSTQSMD